MIETTIAGFWHSRAKSLLTLALFGTCLTQLHAQIVVDTPNLEDIQKELEVKSELTGREMIGVVLPLDLDFFEEATYVELADRGVWSLEVQAPGALATCLYFDDFHLPVGSELRFETPEGAYDKTWVEGPLGAFENNDARRWSNNEVPGESVWMIYECPLGLTEQAALDIYGLGYFARHQNFPTPWQQNNVRGGGSAECQIDVNCPEGDSWECEKDAVVKLRITSGNFIGVCTGSMVNNTARDCRQLMFSAFHCVNDLDADDWNVFKVQYNYEYFDCGGTSSINSRTRTGVTPLTDSNDMPGGNNTGSDLSSVKSTNPFRQWQPYYAGWDASGYNGASGVSIHHPNGDRKKISTYTWPLTSGSWLPWTSTNAHWRVIWSATETDHGVTEAGLQGHPFLKKSPDHWHADGGGSFCNAPTQADLYGKMSYHWDGPNPIPTSAKLKAYLDPIGTGEEFMDGSYVQMDEEGSVSCDAYLACGVTATQVEEQFAAGLSVSPNPSKGLVRIALPSGFELAKLQWFDSMGRALGESEGANFSGDLDLSAWGSGVRYVTVTTKDGWSTTRRVVVQ